MKLQYYRNAVEHIMGDLERILGALDLDMEDECAKQQKKMPTPQIVM